MKPTKGDFDRATAQPWSPQTCLVAQLMIRKGIDPHAGPCLPTKVANLNGLRDLMTEFDDAYSKQDENGIRQGVDPVALANIRKSLPLFNWPWQKLVMPDAKYLASPYPA